jgi:REP element-mobilizing transposase RayT
MDRLLAECTTGPLYLRRREIASMIVQAIRYRDPGHYLLHAFAVMPNHVHILITPKVPLSQLMQSLKRYTPREGN